MSKLHLLAYTLISLATGTARAADLYVGPSGDDANPGTQDKPLRTFAGGQKAARAARASGEPVTVHFAGGTYYLPEPLVLTAEDSGTRRRRSSGGPTRDRPSSSAAAGSSTCAGRLQRRDLQARRPRGMCRPINSSSTASGRSWPAIPTTIRKTRIFNGYAADAISPERAARWADPAGGFIHAMHAALWGGYQLPHHRQGRRRQASPTRAAGRTTAPAPLHEPIRFVENIFEELDAPGEWFLERQDAHALLLSAGRAWTWPRRRSRSCGLRHLVEFRGTKADAGEVRDARRASPSATRRRTFMENREPLLRSDWTIYRGGAVFFNGARIARWWTATWTRSGGNAVFVNDYNRRVAVRGCHIDEAGANGVCFVGDPKAVRSPLFEYGQRQTGRHDRPHARAEDRQLPRRLPGGGLPDPRRSGRVEKQIGRRGDRDGAAHHRAPLLASTTCPRAGINIGDGCWGGHVIEFCDVFDTVKETGDHGSFNSWGRDRYWGSTASSVNTRVAGSCPTCRCSTPSSRSSCATTAGAATTAGTSTWTTAPRNYHIYNNLCLNGGIKNREGFYRVVENNIMVNNTFHPHVWYRGQRGRLPPQHRLRPPTARSACPSRGATRCDNNLLHDPPGLDHPRPATEAAKAARRDEHSIRADALFVDPAHGDLPRQARLPGPGAGLQKLPDGPVRRA